jgi:hypothetical protein
MARWQLIGFIQPAEGAKLEDFRAWYLENHVEDTVNCPGFVSARVFECARPFRGTSPPGWMTIYEVEADDLEQAEAVLSRYQRDPNAYAKRLPRNGSLQILSAGWYRLDRSFEPIR